MSFFFLFFAIVIYLLVFWPPPSPLFLFLFLFLFFSFCFVFSAFGGCSFYFGGGFVFLFCFLEPHLQADLCLLGTRTCGAWWCRYRGHWRSGARHLSPRSRVYEQEWHRKDIHSHIIHSHPAMHTPKTKNKTLNSPNMTPSFSNPLPVQCCGGRRPGSLTDAPRHCSKVGRLLA